MPETLDTPDVLSTNFRHSGWQATRRRIWQAMLQLGFSYSRRLAFAECGSGSWILRHKDDPELFRAVPDFCHDRFCVPCASSRQAIIRRNLDHYLQAKPHRFLTLTIRNTDQTLARLVTRLYKAFRRLRARRFWKDRVRGGVAFLELTYNDQRHTWNPHLHCVLEGVYLDLQDLSRAWLQATGDSKSIRIFLIRNQRDVVNYVTKYATKPLPANVTHHPQALAECLTTLRRRRTVVTFGTWRRWKLLDDPSELDWTVYGHLDEVRQKAIDEDPLALNVLAMLSTADPNTGQFVVHVESPEPDQ